MLFDCSSLVAIDVFLKSFIIVSNHCKCNGIQTGFTKSESGFRFVNRMHLLLNPDSDSLYPNPDSLIEYPPNLTTSFTFV